MTAARKGKAGRVVISASLSAEAAAQLERYLKETGRSRSEVVKSALDLFYKRPPAAKKSLIADLAASIESRGEL